MGQMISAEGMQSSSRSGVSKKTTYSGLDWLKFGVAILVIANHTGPLSSYNKLADFLFSGLLSRIAVPVFFISSGFFYYRKLTGDAKNDKKLLLGYVKKIGKLYLTAMLLYIPLNLYTGYFADSFTLYSLLKDILFDGTFYHLWYLPALIIGIMLFSFMVRKMSMKMMLAVSSLLYIIGLFGDSYYGLITDHQGIVQVYGAMFHWFDYTRNGLFFAPVYLTLGALAAKMQPGKKKTVLHASLFLISLAALLTEGMLLRSAGIPRHDSMYIFALPASYFLFQWARSWKGKANKRFREWRVWIYILHPIAIVLVRGAAKVAHWESLFIANSLIHFAAVCFVSILMAAVAVPVYGIKFKTNFRRSVAR